jgi:hypothetical protein
MRKNAEESKSPRKILRRGGVMDGIISTARCLYDNRRSLSASTSLLFFPERAILLPADRPTEPSFPKPF